MSVLPIRRAGLAAMLALLMTACRDPSADEGPALEEARLTFVRMAPDAPPLSATEVSFWAKREESREVQIRYALGGYVSKCLRFRVPAGALLDRDSVKITIRVPDARRFDYEFSPAGLRFDPRHPAELEVRYRWADPDLNGDGVVDQRDSALAARFGFWRQERSGERWMRLETQRSEASLEATARIVGFTRYALASE